MRCILNKISHVFKLVQTNFSFVITNRFNLVYRQRSWIKRQVVGGGERLHFRTPRNFVFCCLWKQIFWVKLFEQFLVLATLVMVRFLSWSILHQVVIESQSCFDKQTWHRVWQRNERDFLFVEIKNNVMNSKWTYILGSSYLIIQLFNLT